MHAGTVALLPPGHRFWREVDQAEIGFINLPPGSESMLASTLGLHPGPSSWRSQLSPQSCRQRIIKLVTAADGRSEAQQLPPLIRLAIDMLEQANPNQAADHQAIQLLRRIACDARPLEQLIPDYHRWRLQVRDKLGCSPGKLRQQFRLERAQRMLADPELDIQSIAQICGYPSSSHFIRSFRHLHGVSPGRWRQQHISTSTASQNVGAFTQSNTQICVHQTTTLKTTCHAKEGIPMSDARQHILQLLSEGKISVSEAEKLLHALDPSHSAHSDQSDQANQAASEDTEVEPPVTTREAVNWSTFE